ncbi:MAG: HypC/HybG/HupF family hydrogenase formation chaperone [candidate division Zixibacteria bacterium]|nr:HypC/HybG/HupF family hydrogenase formation chaperone [candidate division Zixibacteria bacterium]
MEKGDRKYTSSHCLAVVPDAAVGDYLLVHAGIAIGIIDEKRAASVLELFTPSGWPLEP